MHLTMMSVLRLRACPTLTTGDPVLQLNFMLIIGLKMAHSWLAS